MKEINITWYQCWDLRNFYSRKGHQSYKEEGSFALDGILLNTDNDGQFVKLYNFGERSGVIASEINRRGVLVIKNGTLLPERFADE